MDVSYFLPLIMHSSQQCVLSYALNMIHAPLRPGPQHTALKSFRQTCSCLFFSMVLSLSQCAAVTFLLNSSSWTPPELRMESKFLKMLTDRVVLSFISLIEIHAMESKERPLTTSLELQATLGMLSSTLYNLFTKISCTIQLYLKHLLFTLHPRPTMDISVPSVYLTHKATSSMICFPYCFQAELAFPNRLHCSNGSSTSYIQRSWHKTGIE